MKTKMTFIVMTLFLVSLTLNESCKKREQPRLRFWPWKVMWIMTKSDKSYTQILDHIDKARKTLDKYVWGQDTLVLNGPAGYTPLKQKACKEWKLAVNDDLMPDTTKLTQLGEIVRGLKEYLDERRDHSASKAWDKIRLAIPRKLYKTYPYFFEKVLSDLKAYYTGPVGGGSDCNSGLRDLQWEKNICHSISIPDPNDPWGSGGTALYHYETIFAAYAEGNTKMMNIELSIEDAQIKEAELRYKAAGMIGNVEDYRTKFSNEITIIEKGIYKIQQTEESYYYIDLDVNPNNVEIWGRTLNDD